MNNYTVELQPDAINDLTSIWMRSPNPLAITRADAIADQLFKQILTKTQHILRRKCTS